MLNLKKGAKRRILELSIWYNFDEIKKECWGKFIKKQAKEVIYILGTTESQSLLEILLFLTYIFNKNI